MHARTITDCFLHAIYREEEEEIEEDRKREGERQPSYALNQAGRQSGSQAIRHNLIKFLYKL